MMTRLNSSIFLGLLTLAPLLLAKTAQAATPNFTGGSSVLESITELSIPGFGTFDVDFQTQNYNGSYGGNMPFFLGDESGADAAVDAINAVLDNTQVNGLDFGDGLTSNGRTNQGFGATERIAYLVPYLLQNQDSEVLSKLGSYDGSDWERGLFGPVALTEAGSQTSPPTSYAVFTQTQAIPTPALLPGLLGLGASIIRRRQKAAELAD